MAVQNTIQIKHGSTIPTASDLNNFELGYCTSNNKIYINNASNNNPIRGISGATWNITYPSNSSEFQVENSSILSNSICFVGPRTTASSSQIKAWSSATISCTSQIDGAITLTVNGNVPSVNIPMYLVVF